MEIVIGVIVLIALLGVAVFALRKKPALPPTEPETDQLPSETTRSDEVEPTAPAPPEPTTAGEPDEEDGREDDHEADRKTPIVSESDLAELQQKAAASEEAQPPEPAPSAAPVAAPEPPSKQVSSIDVRPSDVEALKVGLATTRGGFIRKLKALFERPSVDASLLEEMEEVLLTSDIGVQTSEKILASLKTQVAKGELTTVEQMWAALRAEALGILEAPSSGASSPTSGPRVILFVGVNGVGKTTTIGKLASKYQSEGKKILLAAGDTYRAAASLQLEAWGRRVQCETVKGKDKSDPASVIFTAVERAKEEGFDVVLADTAGRLHTKTNLMEELKKVGRAAEKALGRPVDEIFLVLDATNGQNAIQQVELFGDALPLTGIVLTKLDGTAKGGVILGIRQRRPIPVRYIGVGEKVDDLREFNAESFVEALFSEG